MDQDNENTNILLESFSNGRTLPFQAHLAQR